MKRKRRYFHEETFSMALVLLAMNVLTVPTMAETENGDETAIGYLSYLNMSERGKRPRSKYQIKGFYDE